MGKLAVITGARKSAARRQKVYLMRGALPTRTRASERESHRVLINRGTERADFASICLFFFLRVQRESKNFFKVINEAACGESMPKNFFITRLRDSSDDPRAGVEQTPRIEPPGPFLWKTLASALLYYSFGGGGILRIVHISTRQFFHQRRLIDVIIKTFSPRIFYNGTLIYEEGVKILKIRTKIAITDIIYVILSILVVVQFLFRYNLENISHLSRVWCFISAEYYGNKNLILTLFSSRSSFIVIQYTFMVMFWSEKKKKLDIKIVNKIWLILDYIMYNIIWLYSAGWCYYYLQLRPAIDKKRLYNTLINRLISVVIINANSFSLMQQNITSSWFLINALYTRLCVFMNFCSQ